jgi:hypothetical protein
MGFLPHADLPVPNEGHFLRAIDPIKSSTTKFTENVRYKILKPWRRQNEAQITTFYSFTTPVM